ncbi:sigma-54 dependent transcriptional regulator [uncultured Litoreibacter sp.]|uniref:sigma-54-dependent transcriptional regulator n=1 Tax=uncultured Litoreibacter sp. TaxID=1392394 RepID=UPI00260E0E97|nr:sigma-54 dependent transcriptional regulator [uncultured Litoreibacter sp.]
MTQTVLLVDDDAPVREALGQTLELAELTPVLAGSFIVAKDQISRKFDGVIVTDIRMPGRDGFHLLDYTRSVDPELPVILLTGEGDIPMAVKGMSGGAFDFLEKPCAPKQFLEVVERALAARRSVLASRNHRMSAEAGDAASRMLFGVSELSEQLRDRVRAVAKTGSEVLIKGEPGTGTPKVAEVIHLLSERAKNGFVKRHSVGLTPEALAEALEASAEGSLFLDEVVNLPEVTQFALLDHLEAGQGARILAASYQSLKEAAAEGRFMADLRLKLEAMSVRIPALRERTDDIPVLFRHYLAIACEQAALPVPDVSPDQMARLMAHPWDGNARALMNAAMRFAMGMPAVEEGEALSLAERMAKVERSLIIEVLQAHGGHATETAKALQLPRKTFYDKLSRHNIRPEDYR